jgi:hypothetical protein
MQAQPIRKEGNLCTDAVQSLCRGCAKKTASRCGCWRETLNVPINTEDVENWAISSTAGPMMKLEFPVN